MLLRMTGEIKVSRDQFRCVFVVFLRGLRKVVLQKRESVATMSKGIMDIGGSKLLD